MVDTSMDPKQVALTLAMGQAVQLFTTTTPMSAEDIVKALGFMLGSACGQPLAHAEFNTRKLREMAHAAIDKGIDSARGQYDGRPKLIGFH